MGAGGHANVEGAYVIDTWTDLKTLENTEDALAGRSFCHIDNLGHPKDPMESWSQLAAKYITRGME